jgi:Flp pilus assembly protein TadD
MGAYEQARSELRKALAQAPASEDIRYNLQIVEDLIRREEQKKRP